MTGRGIADCSEGSNNCISGSGERFGAFSHRGHPSCWMLSVLLWKSLGFPSLREEGCGRERTECERVVWEGLMIAVTCSPASSFFGFRIPSQLAEATKNRTSERNLAGCRSPATDRACWWEKDGRKSGVQSRCGTPGRDWCGES